MTHQVSLQSVQTKSPFKVLRESAGMSLDEMSEATYLRRDTLEEVEANVMSLNGGAAMAKEMLFRVACVAAVKIQFPSADGDELDKSWCDLSCELDNSFNLNGMSCRN